MLWLRKIPPKCSTPLPPCSAFRSALSTARFRALEAVSAVTFILRLFGNNRCSSIWLGVFWRQKTKKKTKPQASKIVRSLSPQRQPSPRTFVASKSVFTLLSFFRSCVHRAFSALILCRCGIGRVGARARGKHGVARRPAPCGSQLDVLRRSCERKIARIWRDSHAGRRVSGILCIMYYVLRIACVLLFSFIFLLFSFCFSLFAFLFSLFFLIFSF